MILAVDIGNTRTTMALVADRHVVAGDSVASARLQFRRAAHVLRTMLSGVPHGEVRAAAVASVVPMQTALVTNAIQDVTGRRAVIVDCATAHLATDYDDPASLGADRVCNAVAAHALVGGAAIVVDCGTAATVDCIGADGRFLGGAILPGYRTALRALRHDTAQLPEVPLEVPAGAMGTTTVGNLQSGIVLGITFALDGLVRRIERESYGGAHVPVIATGGHHALWRTASMIESRPEPHLVLFGAALVAERSINEN